MDDDYALALSLQFEGDDEIQEIGSTQDVVWLPNNEDGLRKNLGHDRPCFSSTASVASRPLSIVDESWELIDPVPNIHDLFLQFNDTYFDGKLAGVEVKWSPRMTLCAGLCSYEGRGGLCSIRLSEPLLKLRPRKDLVQTLLHEMIHALLFVTQNNKDHDSHGPEFHKHMYRINKQSGTNITVYHNFHDEVKNYRQHWWKCDGPCQHRPPFYGIVRRAMNRAPSKNDTWWAEHVKTCGGQFTKIKEPEDYGKKANKRKRVGEDERKKQGDAEKKIVGTASRQDISKWFKPVKPASVSASDTGKLTNDDADKTVVLGKQVPIFSGDGHRLHSGTNGDAFSKEKWIERLAKKQEDISKKLKDRSEPQGQVCPQLKIRNANLLQRMDKQMKEVGRTDVKGSSGLAAVLSGNLYGCNKTDENSISRGNHFKSNKAEQSSTLFRKPRNNTDMKIWLDKGNAQTSNAFLTQTTESNSSLNSINATDIQNDLSIHSKDSITAKHPSSIEHKHGSGRSCSSAKNSFEILSSTAQEDLPSTCNSNLSASDIYTEETSKENESSLTVRTVKSPASPIIIHDNSPCNQRQVEMVNCPVCPKSLPLNLINAHLDQCLASSSQ